MKYLAAAASACVACAALMAPAAAAQITVNTFEEVVGSEQPVSGRGFVGAAMVASPAAVAVENLEVFVPPGVSGDLKLSLIAADAKYRGTVSASVGGGTGWQKLSLKTGEKQALSGYTTDTLTAYAEAGDKPLLTRWSPSGTSVQIYVNSERSETSVAWRKDGKVEVQPCRRLSGGSLVRFDTICVVPVEVLGPEPVRIIRRRGGVALEPVLVPLAGVR